eukprot:TRINITY_DN11220_c0_g1_i1.p2 TRINITY_DN11220_c0_g1~~TRINITY_DN11220_c0_g1_i1.p2  ORF type:complete len:153 (-),score=44.05 TRINITY_DN11220_c0_g1_i1:22-480(-)
MEMGKSYGPLSDMITVAAMELQEQFDSKTDLQGFDLETESTKKEHTKRQKNTNPPMDAKREQRLIKNRQSAALSRQRKKEFVGNLQKHVSKITEDNCMYQRQVLDLTNQNEQKQSDNERLEKKVEDLTNENNHLRDMLRSYGAPEHSFPSKE